MKRFLSSGKNRPTDGLGGSTLKSKSFNTDTAGLRESVMRKQLLAIKDAFPDHAGLYSRINNLLTGSKIVRIGIIPLASSRIEASPLLDTLVADPIDDRRWFSELKGRPLSKDILVTQSASFEFVETRNSMTVYPVPFAGPPVEFMECSSLHTSSEYLNSCDLHLFTSVHPAKALVTPTNSEHPQALVLDNAALAQLGEDLGSSNPLTGNSLKVCVVNTQSATKADDLLRASPQNISEHLRLHKTSGIESLRELVRDGKSIKGALLESIFLTCERMIAEAKQVDAQLKSTTTEVSRLRQNWASSAHEELQTALLPAVDKVLSSTLAWHKLYTKADDVESTLYPIVAAEFLPKSRESIDYIVGRVDQASAPASEQARAAKTDNIQHISTTVWRDALAALHNEAVKMHNSAIKAVMLTTLGLQLPVTMLSGLGWYFAEFSVPSMVALAGLGITVGMQRLQSSWLKAKNSFKSSTEALALDAIQRSDISLYKLCEQHITEESGATDSREILLAEARTAAEAHASKADNK